MTRVLLYPALAFAFVVDRIRRLPGARFVAPLVPWVPRVFVLAAIALLVAWGAEASPQRISLADLASGKLSHMQTWIIVSGDLAEPPAPTASSGSLRLYRLSDPDAPNAFLDVRSRTVLPLGRVTVSGRVEGGRDGVPPGYFWTARLNADSILASELPPPMVAWVLLAVAVVIVVARRTSYPWFLQQAPDDVPQARGGVRVTAHGLTGAANERDPSGMLHLEAGSGTAELRILGLRPILVRLHSAFTTVDVGELRGLTSSEPALHVRAADDDLTLGFTSARERDAAFATLAEGGRPVGGARQP